MIVRVVLPCGVVEREVPDALSSWELLTTMRNLGEEAYDRLIDAGYFEGGVREASAEERRELAGHDGSSVETRREETA